MNKLPPLVTCVMITGKDPSRRPLAELAVECFRRQTYERRELLIVNDSGETWFGDSDMISEVNVLRQPTLGHLRNLGLDLARGDLIMQWDDDDFHGRERIENQVEAYRPGRANLLQNEILCDLTTGAGQVVSARKWHRGGFPGTILHPPTSARYPEKARGEDSDFLDQWAGKIDTIDNSTADYVRFHHDSNTWDREHFKKNVSRYSRELNTYEVKELSHVLWMVKHETRQATSPLHVKAVCGRVKWMSLFRGKLFGKLIRATEQRRVLEIGHLHGVSTCYMAVAGGDVTTVDLPQSATYSPRVEDTLAACGLSARIIRHPQGSLAACFDLLAAGKRFDFAYIDGGHELSNVVEDFAVVDALLDVGGAIAFDDVSNARYPDVKRFIDVLLCRDPRYEITTPDENLVVARKVARVGPVGTK